MAAAGGEFTGRRSFTFDERVAYHEAGHALASRVCDLPIAGASILFTNGHHGAVWSDDRSDTVETSDIVAELAAPNAGTIRESGRRRRRPPRLPGSYRQLARRSRERAFVHRAGARAPPATISTRRSPFAKLICRSPRSVGMYIEFCRTEAIALLRDHAVAVHRLADALIKHRTIIGGDVIDAIIKGV